MVHVTQHATNNSDELKPHWYALALGWSDPRRNCMNASFGLDTYHSTINFEIYFSVHSSTLNRADLFFFLPFVFLLFQGLRFHSSLHAFQNEFVLFLQSFFSFLLIQAPWIFLCAKHGRYLVSVGDIMPSEFIRLQLSYIPAAHSPHQKTDPHYPHLSQGKAALFALFPSNCHIHLYKLSGSEVMKESVNKLPRPRYYCRLVLFTFRKFSQVKDIYWRREYNLLTCRWLNWYSPQILLQIRFHMKHLMFFPFTAEWIWNIFWHLLYLSYKNCSFFWKIKSNLSRRNLQQGFALRVQMPRPWNSCLGTKHTQNEHLFNNDTLKAEKPAVCRSQQNTSTEITYL